jgi:predicted dienelactone hydrolase
MKGRTVSVCGPCYRQTFLLFACLVLFPVITRPAGIREIRIPSDAKGPEIVARLWTPCSLAPEEIPVGRGRSVPLTIRAMKDCPPSGKGLPLIVVSHGLFGDVFDHHDTAEFLADAGFAVVTLNHTLDSASTIKDNSQDDIASFLVRPLDVSRVLDFLLSHSQLVSLDPQRIGFFGWSRGGYTGLVLAGAVPDFRFPLPMPCPEKLLMCRQIRDGNIPRHGSGYEPRIKAFVIADPLSFFRDEASLRKVTAPVQLWGSEHGGMGVRPEDVALVAKRLPNHPQLHRPANSGHFAFLFPCSGDVAKADPFECEDPPGFDRAAFHNTFNAQVLDFFRKHLSVRNGG